MPVDVTVSGTQSSGSHRASGSGPGPERHDGRGADRVGVRGAWCVLGAVVRTSADTIIIVSLSSFVSNLTDEERIEWESAERGACSVRL